MTGYDLDRQERRAALDAWFDRAHGGPSGGLAAYVQRIRCDHGVLISPDGTVQGCVCRDVMCSQHLLLAWCDELVASYEAKVQELAAETTRAATLEAREDVYRIEGRGLRSECDALIDEIKSLRAKLAAAEQRLRDQEHALNFEQTCEGCGRSLEIALRERERREAAERRLRELERHGIMVPFPEYDKAARRAASAEAALAAVRELADRTPTFGGSGIEGWVNLADLRHALAAEQDESKQRSYHGTGLLARIGGQEPGHARCVCGRDWEAHSYPFLKGYRGCAEGYRPAPPDQPKREQS